MPTYLREAYRLSGSSITLSQSATAETAAHSGRGPEGVIATLRQQLGVRRFVGCVIAKPGDSHGFGHSVASTT